MNYSAAFLVGLTLFPTIRGEHIRIKSIRPVSLNAQNNYEHHVTMI